MTGSSPSPALELRGLSKSYKLRRRSIGRLMPYLRTAPMLDPGEIPDQLWALRDVSATVHPGEVVGVIGPNGAGKSTLLKILARVTLPSEGEAVVRGRVVPLLRLGAGFHREYSGRENVFLNAAMHGIPRAVVERRIVEIFEWAELVEQADMPVKHYSSGQYLRLAFSVAMHMDPDILLADEVLAVGDAAFQERCLERVAHAGEEGMSVLFVSHDMAALRRIASRVIRLDSGRLLADGPADEVIAGYERDMAGRIGVGHRRVTSDRSRVELRDARLLDASGAPLEAPLTGDDILIELDFEAIAGVLDITPGIQLEAGGVLVLASESPESVYSEEPTAYRARLRIPGPRSSPRGTTR